VVGCILPLRNAAFYAPYCFVKSPQPPIPLSRYPSPRPGRIEASAGPVPSAGMNMMIDLARFSASIPFPQCGFAVCKTKISLKNGFSQLAQPFYGMKPKLPPPSQVLGSDDLIARFDLSSAFTRFCGPKKPKEELSSFIGGICGTSNLNIKDSTCSLRSLVDKPPIIGREIMGISSGVMSGFKLAPGPIPENYRFFEVLPSDASLLNGQETSAPDRPTTNTADADPSKPRKLKRAIEDLDGEEKDKKRKKKDKKDKKRKDS